MSTENNIESNKDVIRRWIAARNGFDIEGALACWSDETHASLRPAFNEFSAGFPDLHININDMIAEGNKVVAVWTFTGTHHGVWRGIPATGNAVRWSATDVYTVVDGKIAALHRAADNFEWLKQLGAVMMWQDTVIL